jgi:OmpA-OmpF porin, OOP family
VVKVRMRLRALLFALVALAGAGFAAWKVAGTATAYVERSTRNDVAGALADADQDWVEVATDGMVVSLSGSAPDETERFRALEIARQVVDPRRVRDGTTLQAPDPLRPPDFALEMLRNEHEVSLIGLVPSRTGDDRSTGDTIRAGLDAADLGGAITDMLEAADHPAPERWEESLAFGLDVLGSLPRAKVSVSPGRVGVIAVAEDPEAKASLEARLALAAPDGVNLDLDVSAPRPVIAPFALEYRFDGQSGRFLACSAESAEDAEAIFRAARETGTEGSADCAIGLGAPSTEWPQAVAAGVAALRALGGGSFAISNTEAVLTAPGGTAPEAFEAAGAELDEALPSAFSLQTVMPQRMEDRADGSTVHAPRFDAVLGEDGVLTLTGAVGDQTSRQAIGSYAAALFGHERVQNRTVIDPDLPEGWPGRVLAGIDALTELKEGRATVSPEDVALVGWGIAEDTEAKVAALLDERVTKASVAVRFDAEAAAAAALEAARAAMSRPEICAEEVAAILQDGSINFRAGSSEISPESQGVIAAIADVLRTCPGAEFEVAGHTDSQGEPQANQELSETRARAVQFALESQDLPLIEFRARGYGSAYPVADNATPEGRLRNRRIELTLFSEAPPAPEPVQLSPEACATRVAEALAQDSIQFNLGSSDIAPESAQTLVEVAGVLGSCPGAAFEIAGHTDNQGRPEVNQRISEERAQAVLEALQGADLPSDLVLTARGYGSERPIADNDSPEGRARNRRIELTLAGAAEGDQPQAEQSCQGAITALLEGNTIQFAPDSALLSEASGQVIETVAAAMRDCPGAGYEIRGHTDSVGSESVNQRISEERAQAVVAALDAEELPQITLAARGFGQDQPIADNDTEEGRAQNRRIEIVLVTPPPAAAEAPDAAGETAEPAASEPSEDGDADAAAAPAAPEGAEAESGPQ